MECSCKVDTYSMRMCDELKPDSDFIDYCPLHKAAPEMLAALKPLIQLVEDHKRGKIWDINYIEITNALSIARAAIATAESTKKGS